MDSLPLWFTCSLSIWANAHPGLQDKKHPCLSPALSVWSLQGRGSPDLVSSVVKATYSSQHVLMERMTEKPLVQSQLQSPCLGGRGSREYWPIPAIVQYYLNKNWSGLLKQPKLLPGDGMAAAHVFSYFYNAVFTICNSPPSIHTAITVVWINKSVPLSGAYKK